MPPVRFHRDIPRATEADLWETLDEAGTASVFLSPVVVMEELARRESARQTAEIVRLTRHVRNLTVALAVVAALSLLAAVIAAWAAVVLLRSGA